MEERGEIPKSKVEEYERATKGDIPERVEGKEQAKKLAKRKAKKVLAKKAKEAK